MQAISVKNLQGQVASLDEEAQASAKESVRILSEDELSLKVVEMQDDVRGRVIRGLSSEIDGFEIVAHGGALKVKKKSTPVKSYVEQALFIELEHTTKSGEFGVDNSESSLPKHHCIKLLETEEFLEPVLCKSMRIDENVINGQLCHKLPKLGVTVCGQESSDTKLCLHAPMGGIGLASLKQGQPAIKYLAAAGIGGCYGIIFWDECNQVALMAQVFQDDLRQEVFDFMLTSMSYGRDSSLKMFVFGGYTYAMAKSPGFFDFIENIAKSRGVSIVQTFLGNHGERPRDVIFDVEAGTLFELVVKENPKEPKLGLFNVEYHNYGKKFSLETKLDREVAYRLADAKNSDLLIPVLVEES